MNTTDVNNAIHRLRYDIYLDDQRGREARRADIEHVSHELGLAEDTIDRLVGALASEVNGATFLGEPALPHPDDVAVNRFARALKEKLAAARVKGRGGWHADEPGMQQRLSDMLRNHLEKGDPRDVANFCMFLHQRGEAILPAPVEQSTARATMQFTLGQAETLLAFFGGQNADMTVESFPTGHWPDQPTAPAGLYVYCTEYPDEGAQWLGEENNSEDIQPTWQHIPADRAEHSQVPLGIRRVMERFLKSQESLAESIDTANPDDSYASLIVRDDIDAVRQWLDSARPTPMEAILAAVMAEIEAATAKFPTWPTDPLHAVMAEIEAATAKFPTWPTDPLHAVTVLGEEFGELTKAVMQATYEPYKNGPGAVRIEAVQTAAMALRFLASLDRYEYAPCGQHRQDASGTEVHDGQV
ncbi:MAG: hypothetical protein ACYC0F_05330 [Rhodanobacter sp.]